MLLLSWNWGHVNLNTAAVSFGKQTFSEWLCVAEMAFGRINLEEGKPATDTNHSWGKIFRFYFHVRRPSVYNSLSWAISWLSFSSSLPIYVTRAEFHFQQEINNFNFWTHINIKYCICLKSKGENGTSKGNVEWILLQVQDEKA